MAAFRDGDYNDANIQIHLPPCDNKDCSEKLLLLATEFEKAGVNCLHKYTPNGLYLKSFVELTKTSSFTILHICLPFWNKKISKIHTVLADAENAEKIICIRLDSFGDYSHYRMSELVDLSNMVDCEAFFDDFKIRDVESKADLTQFVQDVKEHLQSQTIQITEPKVNPIKTMPETEIPIKTMPQKIEEAVDDQKQAEGVYDQVDHYVNFRKSDDSVLEMVDQLRNDETKVQRESNETMTVFPDMFGQTSGQDIHVRTDLLRACLDRTASLSPWKSFQELRCSLDALSDEPTEVVEATQYFVLKKVIPQFYEWRSTYALAHIALCSQAVLQNEAYLMLELLVLEGQVETANLIKTKDLLDAKSNRNSVTKIERPPLSQKRLRNLLMMISNEVVIHRPPDRAEKQRASSKIRNPFKKKTADFVSSTEVLPKKAPEHLMKTIKRFCESVPEASPSNRANKLAAMNVQTQGTVVYECLRQIFSSMKVHLLVLLREYVKSSKGPSLECIAMIEHALTIFLCHGLRTAHGRDIQDICTSVMGVLSAESKSVLSRETRQLMCTSIFDKTPVIRQGMIQYFKERTVFAYELDNLLLQEINRLLCPLLTNTTTNSIESGKTMWVSALGKFSHKPAVVLFHKPREKDHWSASEVQFINFADTMHVNQVNKLLVLQHENIITLFAYQLTRIPQFYILEDCFTNNLQMALKNRNDNKKYFEQPTLMKMLICVLDALDYCHSKDVVHRNLTADSLFLVVDSKAKLGGFNLAIDLDGQKETTYMKGSSQIPTRWSAPESLYKLMYSKASDVSMFGHLMYEILTHGALPYSHISLSQVEFVKQVTSQEIKLCQEACMKKEVNELIFRCVAFEPGDRPDTAAIKEDLSKLSKDISATYKPKYPSLAETPSGYTRQPSTSFGKGTPEYEALPSEYNMATLYVASLDGIKQYRMEKVRRQIPHHMKDQLSRATKDVIPTCMTIQEVEENIQIFEYFIPSFDVCNALEAVSDLLYENDLCTYLELLIKLAEKLDQLHNAAFVLGDISLTSVFLQKEEDKPNPNIVSWACLNCIDTYSTECHINFPHMSTMARRAAPEVLKSGLYSPASDVYCFGYFIEDFTTALRRSLLEDLSAYNNILHEQVANQHKMFSHRKCLSQLTEVAFQCTMSDKRRRLSMAEVIQKINRLSEQVKVELREIDDGEDSNTFIKTPFDSEIDNHSQVIPKTVYSKRNSFDSGCSSFRLRRSKTSCTEILDDVYGYDGVDSMPIYEDAYTIRKHVQEAHSGEDFDDDDDDLYSEIEEKKDCVANEAGTVNTDETCRNENEPRDEDIFLV